MNLLKRLLLLIIILLVSGCAENNSTNVITSDNGTEPEMNNDINDSVESETFVVPISPANFILDDLHESTRRSQFLFVDQTIRTLGKCVNEIEEFEPTYQLSKKISDSIKDNRINRLNLVEQNLSRYSVYCGERLIRDYVLVVPTSSISKEDLGLALGIVYDTSYIPGDIKEIWESFFSSYLTDSIGFATWSSLETSIVFSMESKGVLFIKNLQYDDNITCSMRQITQENNQDKISISCRHAISGREPYIGLTARLSFSFIYSDSPPILEFKESWSDRCEPSVNNCQRYYRSQIKTIEVGMENNEPNNALVELYFDEDSLFENQYKFILETYLSIFWQNRT